MRFEAIVANGDKDPDKKDHPGQPWTPPQDPPSPDGTTPDGPGKHKK
ncbi:hypothetical protein [Embleya sp. NPDC050493]